MNNVISTSGSRLAATSKIDECFDILAEAGYTVVDFWLCRYCKTDGIPMAKDDFGDWAKQVGVFAKERGLKIGQVHAHFDHPWQINEDFTFEYPHEIITRNFEATALMGCDKLIFHPIQRWFPMPDEAMRKRILDINIEWFGSMLPLAEKYGVELHIENLFDYKHVGNPGDPIFPFSTVEDLLYTVNGLGSPLAKVCLDTGHANINNLDVADMVRKLGDKLGTLHLDDNYGKIGPIYEDIHLFPGYARVKWSEIFAALSEIGYSGTLNIEPGAELKTMPREIRVIQMRAAREIVDAMQRIYG